MPKKFCDHRISFGILLLYVIFTLIIKPVFEGAIHIVFKTFAKV